MTITKKELINLLHDALSQNNFNVKKTSMKGIIDLLFLIMKNELKKGNSIKLSEIGILKVVTRKQKKGRNLKTGEEIIIPERKAITFKMSKMF